MDNRKHNKRKRNNEAVGKPSKLKLFQNFITKIDKNEVFHSKSTYLYNNYVSYCKGLLRDDQIYTESSFLSKVSVYRKDCVNGIIDIKGDDLNFKVEGVKEDNILNGTHIDVDLRGEVYRNDFVNLNIDFLGDDLNFKSEYFKEDNIQSDSHNGIELRGDVNISNENCQDEIDYTWCDVLHNADIINVDELEDSNSLFDIKLNSEDLVEDFIPFGNYEDIDLNNDIVNFSFEFKIHERKVIDFNSDEYCDNLFSLYCQRIKQENERAKFQLQNVSFYDFGISKDVVDKMKISGNPMYLWSMMRKENGVNSSGEYNSFQALFPIRSITLIREKTFGRLCLFNNEERNNHYFTYIEIYLVHYTIIQRRLPAFRGIVDIQTGYRPIGDIVSVMYEQLGILFECHHVSSYFQNMMNESYAFNLV